MVVCLAKIYELQIDAQKSTTLQPMALLLLFLEETSNFHDVINWLLHINKQLI